MSTGKQHAGALDTATKLEMWRRMLRIRRFDEVATRMLRLGEMPGVLHNTTGQEAEVVGSCMALETGDYVVGTHRNHGHPIALGAELAPLMAEVLGRIDGVCKGKAGEMHLIDPKVGAIYNSGILGSGLPVAVGIALSSQMRRTEQVTMATFGDGAANEGAVHESMNLAAIWKLPIVFVCENNGYAVTVPATYSLPIADVALRGAGYGMPGKVVAGQDPIDVHAAVRNAVELARKGEGPSLIEVKTYRTVDHAENLPSQAYRSEDEVASWRKRDPLSAFRKQLIQEGAASESDMAEIAAEVEREIESARDFALASPIPDREELWADMYSDPLLNHAPVDLGVVK